MYICGHVSILFVAIHNNNLCTHDMYLLTLLLHPTAPPTHTNNLTIYTYTIYNRNLHQNIGQQYVYHLKYLQIERLTGHYLLQLLQHLGLRNMLLGGILMYVVCSIVVFINLMFCI